MSEVKNFLVGNDEFYGEKRQKFRRLYDDLIVFDTKGKFGEIISYRSASGRYKIGDNFFDAAGLSDVSLEFLYKGVNSTSQSRKLYLLKGAAGAVIVSAALHKSCGFCFALVVKADADSAVRVLCSGLVGGIEVSVEPSAKLKIGKMRAKDEDTYAILFELAFYLRAGFSLNSADTPSYMEVYRRTKVIASLVGCSLEAADTSIFDGADTGYYADVLGGMLLCTMMFIRRMTDSKEAIISVDADGGDDLTTITGQGLGEKKGAKLFTCPEIRKCTEIASRIGARYEFSDDGGHVAIRLCAMPRGVAADYELKADALSCDTEGQTLDDMVFTFELE